jgi:hypothetical protein
MEKQMKYWEQKLATYVWNHRNICNILIYFQNIRMKHLQHTYMKYLKHLKHTLATCAFKRNIYLLLGRNGGSSTQSSMPQSDEGDASWQAAARLQR